MRVVVTADPKVADEVAGRLAEAGLTNCNSIPKLGIITGETDDMDALKLVEGVKNVREERPIRLVAPPPNPN